MTLPWKIKGGIEVEDIFMRFTTGINGTPMPSFVKALSEEDRWYLANYIKSLQRETTSQQVLTVLPVSGAVPDDPLDEAWNQAEPLDVRLAGQVIAPPRWQNPSIDLVTVRAIANETEIAFRLIWDDPFKDVVHQQDKEFDVSELGKVGVYSSYVKAYGEIARDLDTFRDSVALQFPVKSPEGTKKPHFFRGNSSNQVNMWIWQSDLDAAGKPAAIEANARGWRQPPKLQGGEKQQLASKAVWEIGRAHV